MALAQKIAAVCSLDACRSGCTAHSAGRSLHVQVSVPAVRCVPLSKGPTAVFHLRRLVCGPGLVGGRCWRRISHPSLVRSGSSKGSGSLRSFENHGAKTSYDEKNTVDDEADTFDGAAHNVDSEADIFDDEADTSDDEADTSDDEAGTFEWGEGSIIIPKFDENFFPVDEDGSIIDMPPPPRGRKPELDENGNPIKKRTRKTAAAKQKAAAGEEDDDPEEKGPRRLLTQRQVMEEATAQAKKNRAKKKKKDEGGEEEEEEETVDEEADGEPMNETEYYEALVAELEAESAALDDNDRRKLLSYRRILKGKLLSQLRHSVLKQVSSGKVVDQKTELLQAAQKAEVKWYTVNCTVPEKRVADLLRTNMAKYAPNEEYDIRLPEIPEVRILKSGEARFYSTFVTNNIIFFRVRMVPEVVEAMQKTRGLYNIEGAQDDSVKMGVAPAMKAEAYVKMLEEAEKKVAATVAAAQAKVQKEKEEAAKKKADAAAMRKAKKEGLVVEEVPSQPEGEGGGEALEAQDLGVEEQPVFKTEKYAPGTYVEVSQGPFAGLQGEVTATDRLNKKLKVQIVVLGEPTEIDLQFKEVRPVKEAPPNLAADPFNPLQRRQNQTAGQSAQRSIPRTVLDWDIGQLSRKADALSDDEVDRPGVSGQESDLEGGADLSEKARGVPLRSGVEIVVKKGPFKGCTGHITEVLMEDGVINAQIVGEGEIRLQPLEADPQGGGDWELPPEFQSKTTPVKRSLPPKLRPKKQLLWLDEGEEEETEPVRKLGADGRPKDPDWTGFERKPRGGVENDVYGERADPRQKEIRWQKLSFTLPTGKTKRLMVKYLGTNADNSAEMLLTEDFDVVTGIWRRLKPAAKAGSEERRRRKKKKEEERPAFMAY